MMILQVAAVVALIIIIIDIVFGKVGKKNNIPAGPRGLPLVGNLVDAYLQSSEAYVYLRNISQKYGPLATLYHGSTPVLVVSSMKMANQILKSHDASFCSRPSVLGQQKLSYSGIDMAFSPFNHHWREMRKLCALHLLSPKQVLSFCSTREDEVSRMIANIKVGGDHPVNLSAVAMSLASNLITRVAFGRRYDDHEFEKRRLDRLIMEAQALMVSFYFSDHFPALGWLDKASGLLARLHKNCAELDVFYQQLIDEHRSPTRQPDSRQDIIDLMIQLKHADATTHDWDDHIKALLMNLFIAGTDTVAAAIVWSMTALMQKPSVMKKVQAEIRGLGERSVVSEDDMKELRYLEAVVLEALRLYPPAPLLYRTQILDQECTRVEGYDIEPGTGVIINGWAIGRDPERWENAEEFEPERFMRMQRRDALEMMLPFGGGRRGCPGKEMGLISIQLALANLLYSFDWALPLPEIIDTHALPGLTMHKKNALLLLPTPYR